MKIYMAGPLFTRAEQDFNTKLADRLRQIGFKIWLPQDFEQQQTTAKAIFDIDVQGVDWCDIVLANMDGSDPDSGTCWEVGYAYKRKHIILYRTDIRSESDPLGPYNLMMHQSADAVVDCKGMAFEAMLQEILKALYAAVKKRMETK
jgi:nucleoside 2-deoxyribosyltransferase